jgi:hypothetical protein
VFISAGPFDDGRLAICLASGIRGEHRVVVLDATFRRVASFPIPSRSARG